jgi:hypothetical protein
MAAGDVFPPIVVFTDGTDSWLSDGIHRLDGAIKAKKKIGVDTRNGTKADAIEFACGANAAHGMRRTNADKKRSVQLALSAFPDRSSRAIADLCGVGHPFVEQIRQVESDSTCTKKPEKTRVGRDGKRQPAAKVQHAVTESDGSQKPDDDPAGRVVSAEAERQWGEGDSLQDVQADLKEVNRRCKELSNFVRKVLRCDGRDPKRPYCGEYSLTTLSDNLLHVGRVVMNDLPVGGTPKNPILFHEEKAKSLAK